MKKILLLASLSFLVSVEYSLKAMDSAKPPYYGQNLVWRVKHSQPSPAPTNNNSFQQPLSNSTIQKPKALIIHHVLRDNSEEHIRRAYQNGLKAGFTYIILCNHASANDIPPSTPEKIIPWRCIENIFLIFLPTLLALIRLRKNINFFLILS